MDLAFYYFQTDFEIGKRHLLPIVDVIDKEGNIQFKLLDEGKNENFENISNEAFNSIGDKFKVTYASNFF